MSERPAYQRSAEFSACGRHRHRLDRWWSDAPRALVCGANPSTAGSEKCDQTIYRVIDLLCWREGIGGVTMINACDRIATDPAEHARWCEATDLDALRVIRAANLAQIRALAAIAPIRIAAWGALLRPGLHANRIVAALSLDGALPIHAFALTEAGAPKHPLARGHHRIPNDAPLVEWHPAGLTESVAA